MLRKIKSYIELSLSWITSGMLVMLVALAIWQVFTRYVLKTPALFTEELLRFSMIWMALLGAAYAFGIKEHLSLGILPDMLTGRKRKALVLFNDLVVLSFAFFILFLGGMRAVESSMNQFSPILRLPMGQVYYILPITAVLIFVLQGMNSILALMAPGTGPDTSTPNNRKDDA
ncbi:TRAP transporter small permease [uncultured Cohaesibacter sp.]|uniref:TRAP transporter small permease n=1 Tax=uncultured Cohaesibacter sp. TaxID=1002546 RepID=UPI0029C9869C|nr:TRAP transporter small permease [uncultured Cohaesibacter sp.]